MFDLYWTDDAREEFDRLKKDQGLEKQYKAVSKAILFLASNPRHPSLQTHEFISLQGPRGEKVFEAYAQQNTPSAYRIFWYYGPRRKEITILAITPHP